jgi:hypothetical protein
MAAEASRLTFHLSQVFPAFSSATDCCRLIKASVIGRRPNGVATLSVCIVLYLSSGKSNSLIKTMPKTLDDESRKCDSTGA